MALFLTDMQISQLIAEPKRLPSNWREGLQPKPKTGHKESEIEIISERESRFKLMIRQSLFNLLDFSVILAFKDGRSNQVIRLKRYNGKSHEHSNSLETQTFYDFHIHIATERYQKLGHAPETFAEVTDRYSDVHGAINCMIDDCGFIIPDEVQPDLFRGKI